jgi:hypothetical protein
LGSSTAAGSRTASSGPRRQSRRGAGLAETTGETVTPRQAIELPAGRPVPLRPGRLHIRLEGLKQALEQGEIFPLTLRFAVSPPVEIAVVVESEAGH